MSRKTQIINEFEVLLIQLIEREGLVNSNSLLALCIFNRFTAHAVLLTEGFIECQEFNHVLSGWKCLIGERNFDSMRRIELDFIKAELGQRRLDLYENEYH